jgi:CRP/FNR family transcriptional regulator, cyclic AMP receptor protein
MLPGGQTVAPYLPPFARGTRKDADSQTAVKSVNSAYLAAKSPLLQRQFRTSLGLGDLPFIVGRGPVAREGVPPLEPDLKLNDNVPFRLSRNHFMIEKRDGNYYVRVSLQHAWNDRQRRANRRSFPR